MDREISAGSKSRNRRKKIISFSVALLSLVLVFWLFNYLINTPIKRSKIVTGIAKTGKIEATLNASAVVLPEFDEVIISPIQANIQKINFSAGSIVDSGQSILQLNKEFVILEYQRKLDQLDLSKTQLSRTAMHLDKNISDLETEYKIKLLKNQRFQAVYKDAQKLLEIGGGTLEEVELARMNFEIGELELEQLDKQIKNRKESKKAELKEIGLTIQIQEKNVDELKRKINQADIMSSRHGVVTWVKEEIGSNVMPGEVIARVADLSSFKVEGRISDVYAGRISVGQEAIVRINDDDLRGIITSIRPAVKNGIVTFAVALQQKSHEALRPQLKAEIFIVTGSNSKAVIVPNGAAFTGLEEQILFVIEDGKAHRREVTTGLSNIDFVEITSGISEGEEVIISDMRNNEKRESIRIK